MSENVSRFVTVTLTRKETGLSYEFSAILNGPRELEFTRMVEAVIDANGYLFPNWLKEFSIDQVITRMDFPVVTLK